MFVILQVNADFLINQLTKYFYTRQLNFLLHFLLVLAVDEMSCISQKYQPPNNLAKHQYFYTRDFISLLHFGKKIGALHRKRFSKHPLFTTFSIFLKVSEVCNISSKWWLPNKSANKIFLHKTPYLLPLIQKKLWALHRRIL